MTLIYINDLKGSLPVKLVRIMANKMQRKATSDMYKGMTMYMNNQLNLDDDKADLIYKQTKDW